MRYRPLDANGDYTVGIPFLVNSPECVAQAIQTRLGLWQGEFFADTSDGTLWAGKVLGKRRPGRNPDLALKQRILGTQGVTQILLFSSSYSGGATRQYSANVTVMTLYSQTPVSLSIASSDDGSVIVTLDEVE